MNLVGLICLIAILAGFYLCCNGININYFSKTTLKNFRLCDEQLSNQSHYDFGLRALKSVLISAGNVKRDRIQKIKEGMKIRGDVDIDEASIAENLPEQEILIQSVCETMVPKLVAEDIPLLFSLLNDVFPNVGYTRAEMKGKYIYA